jgi:hypothetical protein
MNEDIIKQIKIKSAKNKIDRHRQGWINHWNRMTDERITNRFYSVNQRYAETKANHGKDGMRM